MSTTTKKKPIPTNTFAITKQDWLDVHKDTITVKRQTELFAKISERLNFLFNFFDHGRECYVASMDDIQCYEDSDILDITNCIIWIDDEAIFGYENVPVFWLWDDSWIKRVKDWRLKQEKEKESNKPIDNLVNRLKVILAPDERKLLIENAGILHKKLS